MLRHLFTLLACVGWFPSPASAAMNQVKTVFVLLEENHAWSLIQGSANAPYINGTLLPMASYSNAYFGGASAGTAGALHPSLPNYLWLDAGTNFGITSDGEPGSGYLINSTQHLETLLSNAGRTWRYYAEGITAGTCPLASSGNYTPHHLAALYFEDDTGPNPPNAAAPVCVANVVPFSQLATDLAAGTCADYNFIAPDQVDNMHSGTIQEADTWLSTVVPGILASQAYLNDGALFITWDEAYDADGNEVTAPIGLIALSPLAKGGGYSNNAITYSHSSTLRSVEEIFGLSPLLGDAVNATDLSDLFGAPFKATPTPTGTVTPTPMPGTGSSASSIGPNPVRAGQAFTVTVPPQTGAWSLEVFNLAGERIAQAGVNGGSTASLSTVHWSTGVYLVRVLISGTDLRLKVAVIP